MTALQPLKTGGFPHQAYRPSCACIEGQPEPALNYAGHTISAPRCSACAKPYQLDITLMPTFEPKPKPR